MKPTLEKIAPDFGNSFFFEQFTNASLNKVVGWHYHPEIEIVYVNSGYGKIQIGSHISNYTNGALLLIGSNLPHCGFTNELNGSRKKSIIQIKPDFMGPGFMDTPEMEPVRNLFELAKKGILFRGKSKRQIGELIESIAERSPFDRLLRLLKILKKMESTKERTILNAEGYAMEAVFEDNNRINLIFNYVKEEFQSPIALEHIASIANMSVPGFCRYFKKITGKTFTQFVNEYRLVHAAKLLQEKQIPINEVCYDSGFNNFSHFNKLFKQFTGKTASAYRNELSFTISD